MNEHSQQLIDEMTKELTPIIVDFFEEMKDRFPVHSISSLVESVMAEYYAETDSLSIRETGEKLRKRFNNTKSRWYTSYHKVLDNNPDIENDKNPFNYIHIQNTFLSSDQWHQLYGENTVSEVIALKKQEIEDWRYSNQSLLLQFTLIRQKQTEHIYAAFRMDVAKHILHIIRNEYRGNLRSFFVAYPQDLIDKPLFSPNRHNIALQSQDNQKVDDFFLDSSRKFMLRTIATDTTADLLRSLEAEDQTILATLMANASTSFYATRRVTMSLADIVNTVYDGKPSSKHYDMIAKKCLALSERSFTYYDENNRNGLSFNFFDHVMVEDADEKGHPDVTVMFGEMLYSAMVDKKLINIQSRNYHSLENKLSKIIYPFLQRERVSIGVSFREGHRQNFTQTYEYADFKRSVRFRTGRIAANIQLLTDAFNEFVKKGIAIDYYDYHKSLNLWEITYLPLSDAEYKDLAFNQQETIVDATEVLLLKNPN